MYGVPKDLNLSRFHGSTLDQIGLGRNVLEFSFSGGQYIEVEGLWQLLDSSGTVLDQGRPARVGFANDGDDNRSKRTWNVNVLLGEAIESTEVNAPESFSLVFTSGSRIRIFDDSKDYESFSIQPGDIFV